MDYDHYGLTGRPFQLTPDPRFWFETATHRKAMAYLGYGLAQGEGFIVITGDVGAGKTTLVGHLMDTVDATRLHVVKLVSTQIRICRSRRSKSCACSPTSRPAGTRCCRSSCSASLNSASGCTAPTGWSSSASA